VAAFESLAAFAVKHELCPGYIEVATGRVNGKLACNLRVQAAAPLILRRWTWQRSKRIC
jgi:hypothetical protein